MTDKESDNSVIEKDEEKILYSEYKKLCFAC